MISTTNLLHCVSLSGSKTILLAGVFAAGAFMSPLQGQSPAPPANTAQIAQAAPANPAGSPTVTAFPKRQHSYYQLFWGVDQLSVRAVESGELIKFSYRVLDAEKAKTLNEKTNEPALYDPAIRAKLVVPSLEKVGQLRQSSTPEAGKVYWMAFSNPGRVVKRGDRVNVVIGQFQINGLMVE